MNREQALAFAFLNVQRKEEKWSPLRVVRSAEVVPRARLIMTAMGCDLRTAYLFVLSPEDVPCF